MAIEAKVLPRVFSFGSMNINDPDPSMTVSEVRDLLSGAYPELTSSECGEPTEKNGALVYKFTKPVGTKG